jgi:DUF4097 and DUF4098 domain-containing protein YvlB
MNKLLCFLALGVLAAAPAALHAKIVRQTEKTFAVQPGGNLRTATSGGDITITTGEGAEVRVVAKQTFRADTEAEADAMAKKLTLTLEQNGNDVVAEAKIDHSGWGRTPVSVEFTIVLPKQFNVDARTSGGDVTVGDLRGTLQARTSGGDLKFARIDGRIEGSTSGGNVTLEEGTAEAKLSTSGGDIRVTRAGGPTSVSTSGGDIRLESVVELVTANTSGGDIFARLTQPLAKDTSLGSSGGDVEILLPKNAAFFLDASTSGGSVDAAGLTITLEHSGARKSRLVGAVNGGGPKLKLRTSGGDIKVRAE